MSVPADFVCNCWPSEYQWAFWFGVLIVYVAFKVIIRRWFKRWRG